MKKKLVWRFLVLSVFVFSLSTCSFEDMEMWSLQESAHTWGSDVVTAPTCTEAGYTTQTCAECSQTRQTNPTVATGHTWGNDVVTAPTCAAGYTTQTCAECSQTHQINPTAAIGQHVWGGNTVTAPTCLTAGYTTQTCSNCLQTQQINPTVVTAHTWGGNAVTAPTCVAAGYTMQTCSNCSQTQQINPTVAIGHNWGADVVTAPTCVVGGYTTQTCSRCSATRQIDPTAATGHAYINGICTACYSIEMVQMPAGTLTWLNATITLSAFKMGKYEVTQEMYQAVMGVNPSNFSSNPTAGEIQGKRPVETVTWYDAVEFCNKLSELGGLTPVYTITERTPASGYPITNAAVTANWNNNGYRLPTEAQWEYAARAGTTTTWHFGNTESQLVNYAWYSVNAGSKTHEVGKKQPNAWGLYDMYGNVWEWCWDRYGSYPSTNQTNYPGPNSGDTRVGRGGSWYDSAEVVNSANRGNFPGSRHYNYGFRVVRP